METVENLPNSMPDPAEEPQTLEELLLWPSVASLLESSIATGSLYAEELAPILNELDNEELAREFMDYLEASQIEINESLGNTNENTTVLSAERETTMDSLNLHLASIGNRPLLTPAREVELSKLILPGEEAKKKLREAEEAEVELADQKDLELAVRKGHIAKTEMVESNLRLVVSIAKKYQNQGLPLLDLIQEGTIGLNRAAEKFDWRKGYKFSTYATWWIKQACQRSIYDKGRTVRVPVHIAEKQQKISRVQRSLIQKLGRDPKPAEIAAETDFTEEEVQNCIDWGRQPVSIDSPVGENGDDLFSDFIEDKETPPTDEAAIEHLDYDVLMRSLDAIPEREKMLLIMCYGLEGEPQTLEAIGRHLDLTRERVRQLETQALKRLASFKEMQDMTGKKPGNGQSSASN